MSRLGFSHEGDHSVILEVMLLGIGLSGFGDMRTMMTTLGVDESEFNTHTP